MFSIDRSSNSIKEIPSVSFSELGFRERQHLQEWIANQPSALGEKLLIIQKEFDGFDDTKERLDLLAIDENGYLVVIENKLDDSGRDVVWQSLKYASYCSTLGTSKIVEIYQDYLEQSGDKSSAKEKICGFLGKDNFDEITLNPKRTLRIILVAAHFRKEVTSTALWLLEHQLKLQCFKVTPLRHGDSLYVDFEQIIPLPEAQEYMIGISEKEKEEQAVEERQARRHVLRKEFWTKTLAALEKARVALYSNVSPSKDSWINAGAGMAGISYLMFFGQEGVRVEFTIGRKVEAKNHALFAYLEGKKTKIEDAFGAPLQWRMRDKTGAIGYAKSVNGEGYDRENWPKMIDWLIVHIRKLEDVFSKEIDGMRDLLETQFPKE
ncbi:hypothetical protein M2103_002620 [Ereboglobus sp. PH5-5]|uniref:DUF4268 domain-containing protein n=1 Tax=Ereboglobus sp. PH5-5 TaxID=2940529 RepID=UPI0024061173|nr:DUF4268 domain-containing protein [Ereboglobus sp. PH5-5]MDF9834371.1 hypothetical protein [Ereboglobus sp. PH5-5]